MSWMGAILIALVVVGVVVPGVSTAGEDLRRLPWGAGEPTVRAVLPVEGCAFASVRPDSERVCVAGLTLGDVQVRAYLWLQTDRLVRVNLLFPSRFHEAMVAQLDRTFGALSEARFPRVVAPPLTFTNEVREWSTDAVRVILSKYHSGYGNDSQASLEPRALPGDPESPAAGPGR